jgi:hypothetical protein
MAKHSIAGSKHQSAMAFDESSESCFTPLGQKGFEELAI